MWQPVAQWRPPVIKTWGAQPFGLLLRMRLRHEAAKLLRLPRVGLHLCLGKIALQPQDVLQVLSFGQLACQREASVGVFLCELNRSVLNNFES